MKSIISLAIFALLVSVDMSFGEEKTLDKLKIGIKKRVSFIDFCCQTSSSSTIIFSR